MAALGYTSGTALKTRMGITDTNSDTVLGGIATAVNELVEGYIGAPVGPAGTAARTFDGNGQSVLWVRQGLTTLSQLRIRDRTGGSWSTLSAGEYALRPASHDRPTGWPGFWVHLTDQASTYGVFTPGYDTVEVTPDSSGFGWAAIPPDLAEVAAIMATRIFQSRQSGEMMVVGSTDFGNAIVRFLPEPEYRAIIDRFRHAVSPTLAT